MTSVRKAPPIDPELADVLAALPDAPTTITPAMIPAIRKMLVTTPESVIGDRPILYVDRVIPGAPDGPELTVTVFERSDREPGGPAIYYIHGGGMIIGDRWFGTGTIIDWVEDLDAVLVTVEYRLAPEDPYPAALDDCYAGLLWVGTNHAELGFDPDKLVIAGASAGGGLCAGVTLRVRDEGGPALAAQVLIYPMLDDRNDTISSYQFDGFGRWDRGSNDTGWNAYLGDRRKTDQVPIYAAPARAVDLSNLPPAYVDVGSAEVFRDECVAYASQMWADAGICELHVWPGGFHAFDMAAPAATLSHAMIETRTKWLSRVLAPDVRLERLSRVTTLREGGE
jgi:acetyl esterase/lipase